MLKSKTETIEIADIWLASAIKSQGIDYLTYKRTEGSRFLVWQFPANEEVRKIVEQAREGSLYVHWRRFVSAYRELSDLKFL